ncbi:MAG TPA: response regulator [Planctomycetaceae bacterium]|nr:response regulator [Planctomycetaceae bacterium]
MHLMGTLSQDIADRKDAHGPLSESPVVPHRHPISSSIMIADDNELNVRVVRAHLEHAGYQRFFTVSDPTDILPTVYREEPDILLLDLMMPHISGLEILAALRADPRFFHWPVVILTAATDHALRKQALEEGATDFLNKPVAPEELVARVRNILNMKFYREHLEEQVAQRTQHLLLAQREVVHCLARAAEYRDNDTGQHVLRVRAYVEIIARNLGLEPEIVQLIADASILHDVGKIGIPDAVLLKPDRLTDEEYDTIKAHCGYGYSICSNTILEVDNNEDCQGGNHCQDASLFLQTYGSPLLRTAATIAATHHEKWDGTGYPRGLRGTDIPLEGRITAVADVFDALSSRRPYKDPFPLERCVAMLREEKGRHFDPRLVDVFLGHLDEVQAVQQRYSDE